MTHNFKEAFVCLKPYIEADKLDPIGLVSLGGLVRIFPEVLEALRILSMVQEGTHKIVPVEEATIDMKQAGASANREMLDGTWGRANRVYKAMLAAAPDYNEQKES